MGIIHSKFRIHFKTPDRLGLAHNASSAWPAPQSAEFHGAARATAAPYVHWACPHWAWLSFALTWWVDRGCAAPKQPDSDVVIAKSSSAPTTESRVDKGLKSLGASATASNWQAWLHDMAPVQNFDQGEVELNNALATM